MSRRTVEIELNGIEKRYRGVRALRGVYLHLAPGQVHGLVGQNGAGKSTLIKILTGAVAADAGELLVNDEPVSFGSPADAERAGIQVVHQESQIFRDLPVADNVFVAHPATRGRAPFRVRDRRRTRARAAQLLDELGIEVDVRTPAGTLGLADRKLIEVARALAADARVLLLDEPTAALERHEVERLFQIVERLCAGGAAVLFVSHKLDEVLAVSSRITVLRDGNVVAHGTREEFTLTRLVHLIAEDELAQGEPGAPAPGEVALAARRLRSGGAGPVDLDVHAGEVVSLTGLLGSGAPEVARALAGATTQDGGEVVRSGRVVPAGKRPVAAALGVGFVAEDRKAEGIVPELSVERNIALASLGGVSRPWRLSRRRLREQALRYISLLDIRPPDPALPVANLSGGNQQKVVLARWLASGAEVLVLEEPTHGIDVGAKAEIHVLLRRFAARGGAVLLVSRETAELLDLSDRIGVFREGRLVATLPRGATEREVAAQVLGLGEDAA